MATQQKNTIQLNFQAYDFIKSQIIWNALKPNEKIDITRLCKELNMSRGPIVSAITRLQYDGYVDVIPKSGTFVRNHTKQELEIIYKSRAALEKTIVASYGVRINHDELLRCSDDFKNLYNDIDSLDIWARFMSIDVRFHALLMSQCEEIILREISNICDLTKRSRFLLLSLSNTLESRKQTLKANLDLHLEIISALLSGDTENASSLVFQDIMSTWEEISQFSHILL